ncbi:hypothetical protein Tco_0689408 [Tanacetum coccineum]
MTESLENVILAKSSSQPQSIYKFAASLTEFELKKILLDKLEKSKSYRATKLHRDLYDALVKSYQLDKDLFDSYGKAYSLKSGREDKDKDEDPPAGSDQGLKKRKTSKDVEPPTGSKSKYSKSSSSKGTKSQPKSSGKSVQAEEPVFKTADTEMPQGQGGDLGHQYLFDLSKPLPLIEVQGRQVVPADYFIDNNLEFLKGGSLSRKYMTFTTKIRAAKYDNIEGIEDMVSTLWSPVKYSVLINHLIRRTHQLDTTYQTFYPEQRIDFYSLNNVSVLPNNTTKPLTKKPQWQNQTTTSPLPERTSSNDNKRRMVEKSIVEIQGTFLEKIRDNAFNGNIGENAFKHIDKFLEIVGPIKINGLTQDRFRLSVFPVSLAGAASEWFTKECIGSITTWENMVERFIQKFYHLSDKDDEEETNEDDDHSETNDLTEIFKIEDKLFDYETPLCKAFNNFNYLLKIDTDLFTFDIQGTKTYMEYESNNHKTGDPDEPCSDINGFCNEGGLLGMVRVGGMTYFQDHKWYDELDDGNLKDETLMHKARIEESWGDATPNVIKFCTWLKSSFKNIHQLDHDVLTKLEECWWKVNAHEVASFALWENLGQGPYANFKTKKTQDPYLDINHTFGMNNRASNVGDTQENQGDKELKDNPTPEPSICKIRRFEMMKYSFNDDEEYIAINESEYLNHSKDSLNAYRELLRLINEGWVMENDE